jgi:frataxin-like iron-binding protein CyaY
LQQVWLASVHGAFHFTRQTQGWIDTRSTKDFWQIFSEQAALEAGMALPG